MEFLIQKINFKMMFKALANPTNTGGLAFGNLDSLKRSLVRLSEPFKKYNIGLRDQSYPQRSPLKRKAYRKSEGYKTQATLKTSKGPHDSFIAPYT